MATILAYMKKPGEAITEVSLPLSEKLGFGPDDAEKLIGSSVRQTVIKQDSDFQIDLFSAVAGEENFKLINEEVIYGDAYFVRRSAINGEYEELIAEDANPEDLGIIKQHIAD